MYRKNKQIFGKLFINFLKSCILFRNYVLNPIFYHNSIILINCSQFNIALSYSTVLFWENNLEIMQFVVPKICNIEVNLKHYFVFIKNYVIYHEFNVKWILQSHHFSFVCKIVLTRGHKQETIDFHMVNWNFELIILLQGHTFNYQSMSKGTFHELTFYTMKSNAQWLCHLALNPKMVNILCHLALRNM